MKKKLITLSAVFFIASVAAQGVRVNSVGSGVVPAVPSLGSPVVSCSSTCSINSVDIPADATQVVLTVLNSSNSQVHSQTIPVTGGVTSQSYTTSSTLPVSTGNTFNFSVLDNSSTVLATHSTSGLTVIGALNTKINAFTDSTVTNVDFVSGDILPSLFASGETGIKSDILANLSDLNAELAEGDHGCSLSGGVSPTDIQVGDYLQCVMEAHYNDVLTAAHADDASPTETEASDGSVTVAIDSSVSALCATTRWTCTLTDTDGDGWELSSDFTTATLSAAEVATATGNYANVLNSQFDVTVSITDYSPSAIAAADKTKTYSSVALPAPPILSTLLAATPAVSSADLNRLGLSSAIVSDIQANLSDFNTNIADFTATDTCNDGTTTHDISGSPDRSDIAGFVGCVMRDHYVDIAAAVIPAASTTITGKSVCSTGIKGPVPSLCADSRWTCTIKNKTPSAWGYTDNNTSSTQPLINSPSSNGSPVSASYTITASINSYFPGHDIDYVYTNINVAGNSPSWGVTKTKLNNSNGTAANNYCYEQGGRLATFAEVRSWAGCPVVAAGYSCNVSAYDRPSQKNMVADNSNNNGKKVPACPSDDHTPNLAGHAQSSAMQQWRTSPETSGTRIKYWDAQGNVQTSNCSYTWPSYTRDITTYCNTPSYTACP